MATHFCPTNPCYICHPEFREMFGFPKEEKFYINLDNQTEKSLDYWQKRALRAEKKLKKIKKENKND